MTKSIISPAEAAEVAALARLELTPEACEALASDLAAVLEHMAVLDEVDTDGIEPMTHVANLELRLRPDDVDESLDQETALAGAPSQEDGCFKVPAAIKAS